MKDLKYHFLMAFSVFGGLLVLVEGITYRRFYEIMSSILIFIISYNIYTSKRMWDLIEKQDAVIDRCAEEFRRLTNENEELKNELKNKEV